MSQTVVGLFKTPVEAQKVKQILVEEGYSPGSIRVLSNESAGFAEGAVSQARTTGAGETGVMGSIKQFFHSLTGSDETEQEYYTRGVSSGGALLAVTTEDQRVESVASLLEAHGAANVTEDGRAATAATTGTAATRTNTNTATTAAAAAQSGLATGEAIPVIDEELQVGKRQVQRGGVRVYSHLVSTPVEENVRLREEHVRVERTPVDRPISAADADIFKERSIELTESAEEAVVAKQARVVEEVKVGKDVSERTETVRDTVRHTEVDVEQLPGDVSQKSTSAGKGKL